MIVDPLGPPGEGFLYLGDIPINLPLGRPSSTNPRVHYGGLSGAKETMYSLSPSKSFGIRTCGSILKQIPRNVCGIWASSLQAPIRSSLSTFARPLPTGTWDSHMHVVDPHRFPLDTQAQYTPHAHTIEDARSFYRPLGIEHMVFVQPSIYGNDNSCMLEALREVGPRNGRAVVQFDPLTIDDKTLWEWHAIGVRGVRVNLVSVGRRVEFEEFRQELLTYAEVIAPLDWVLELYAPLEMAGLVAKVVDSLGVKVCIDHFGSPKLPAEQPFDASSLPGFKSLIELLQGDRTWIKFSAPYRLTKDPEMRDLAPIAKDLLKYAPNRVVYATDWPHTRFENIDPKPFIEKCYQWCDDNEDLVERLFRRNAEELWDARQE